MQNAAARVVILSPKFFHIKPVFANLHWLRIEFKILIVTYKTLHGLAPAYTKDLLQNYLPARDLRFQRIDLSRNTITYHNALFFVTPKFCISIVFSVSWQLKWPQEKQKTMLMQNLG